MWQSFYRSHYRAELGIKKCFKKEWNGIKVKCFRREWNGMKVINTDTSEPDRTTHTIVIKIRWEWLHSFLKCTQRKINSTGSMASPHILLLLQTPLPCDVASRKFPSRRVTQQSTIEFVISDPAVAEQLLLSVSSSLAEILMVLPLLARSSTG